LEVVFSGTGGDREAWHPAEKQIEMSHPKIRKGDLAVCNFQFLSLRRNGVGYEKRSMRKRKGN